jgi:hypothetical protein
MYIGFETEKRLSQGVVAAYRCDVRYSGKVKVVCYKKGR